MKIFYHPAEKEYRPEKSFFNGQFTPYPEVHERAEAIVTALSENPAHEWATPVPLDIADLKAVHDPGYLETLRALCLRLRPGEHYFPPVIRQSAQLLAVEYVRVKAGYYAVDTSTPILAESLPAALAGAAAAKAGAESLLAGGKAAYCLMRPPGHHAGRAYFAGYCIFNNAALAAATLLGGGKVAVLDVDYHHGNGTQDIFYERDDVLYVSLHCRPEEAYPYIAGSDSETGAGKGAGWNHNLPLPGGTGWGGYAPALETALEAVSKFRPESLVVSAGFDTLDGDPIGTFALQIGDYAPMANRIRQLGLPTLVIQEGGYRVSALGECVKAFLGALEPS